MKEEVYLEISEYAFHVFILGSHWYMKIWCDVPTEMKAVLKNA